MNRSIRQLFIALLRCEITGAAVDTPPLADRELAALMRLSAKHDLAHLVGDVLLKNHLIPNSSPYLAEFEQLLNLAYFRAMNYEHELHGITQCFEEAKIPFVVLKGGRVRELYPEPWMRTSCDLDVLVHEEDLQRAADILVKNLRYRTEGTQNFHDLPLYAESGVHLELHFSLLEHFEIIDQVLMKAWDYVTLHSGCRYIQTPEFFLFYHLAHMLRHTFNGGCGMRPFIDLWLLEKHLDYDKQVLAGLLECCDLRDFYASCKRIACHWMDGSPITEEEQAYERYILYGGVYGNLSNMVSVRCVDQRRKSRYILSRIFQDYPSLSEYYPWLKGRKWLIPIAQVCRWCRWLLGDKTRVASEIKAVRRVDSDGVDNMRSMLIGIGLRSYCEKD